MTVRNMHPDLRLGLVLATAAVLLRLGNPGNQLVEGVAQRLEISAAVFGLLLTAGGLGSIAVIAVAIWVDRRPPHGVMAAGALVSLLGLVVFFMPYSFPTYAAGMFISGVGYSALLPVIFYAIVAKGASRHRGLLLGALGALFSAPHGISRIPAFSINEPIWIVAVSGPFILAGAAVIFFLLPRVYAGYRESEQTAQEHTARPRVWTALAWVTAVYFLAHLAINGSGVLNLRELTPDGISAVSRPALQPLGDHILTALGVLISGIASDYVSVRRLLKIAAVVLVLGTAIHWAAGELPLAVTGTAATRFALGGLTCLPWVLMANMLPPRHFAKLSLPVIVVGGILTAIASALVLAPVYFALGAVPIFAAIAMVGVALAIVATLLPQSVALEERLHDTQE